MATLNDLKVQVLSQQVGGNIKSLNDLEKAFWQASLDAGGALSDPLLLADGTAADPGLTFANETDLGFTRVLSNTLSVAEAGGTFFHFSREGNRFGSDQLFGWSPSGSGQTAIDTVLARDAADTVARRNSTNPQEDRLYGTFTDSSNYERLSFKAQSADDFIIAPEAAGTGTLRGLQLVSASGKLGFYGTTAIAQASSTGETTGFTAGVGTSVNDDSTFTGNVGSTAYTISDIVKHLKNLGLIAS